MNFENLWPWGCIGVGIFLFVFAILVSRQFAFAKLWPKTEGIIRESSVHQEWSNCGGEYRLLYKPKVSYEYEVNGKTYAASRLGLLETTASSNEDGMIQKASQFPVGRRVIVYYDPNKPEFASLRVTDPTRGIFAISVLVIGLILMGIGLERIFVGAR